MVEDGCCKLNKAGDEGSGLWIRMLSPYTARLLPTAPVSFISFSLFIPSWFLLVFFLFFFLLSQRSLQSSVNKGTDGRMGEEETGAKKSNGSVDCLIVHWEKKSVLPPITTTTTRKSKKIKNIFWLLASFFFPLFHFLFNAEKKNLTVPSGSYWKRSEPHPQCGR